MILLSIGLVNIKAVDLEGFIDMIPDDIKNLLQEVVNLIGKDVAISICKSIYPEYEYYCEEYVTVHLIEEHNSDKYRQSDAGEAIAEDNWNIGPRTDVGPSGLYSDTKITTKRSNSNKNTKSINEENIIRELFNKPGVYQYLRQTMTDRNIEILIHKIANAKEKI